MGRVHLAVHVDFDGRIDGNHPQAADHLRRIGNFHRPEDDFFAVTVDFIEESFACLFGQGQGRTGCRPDLAEIDQVQDAVLEHLRINVDGVKVLRFHESGQDGIGHIPDPGLPGQGWRDAISFDLMLHKVEDVFGDSAGDGGRRHKNRAAILLGAEQDGH
ncbi:MAG: hypothetical protein ACD_75C01472G0001, partial [uncultured bacterium]